MSEALEALMQEGRTFAPSDAFREQSLVTGTALYDAVYTACRDKLLDESRGQAGLLGASGARARLGAGVDDDPRLGSAVRQVVRRRSPQRFVQLS